MTGEEWDEASEAARRLQAMAARHGEPSDDVNLLIRKIAELDLNKQAYAELYFGLFRRVQKALAEDMTEAT